MKSQSVKLLKSLKPSKKVHKVKSSQPGVAGYFSKQRTQQKVIVLNTTVSEGQSENTGDWETDPEEVIQSTSAQTSGISWADRVSQHEQQLAAARQSKLEDFVLPHSESDRQDISSCGCGHGHMVRQMVLVRGRSV